MSRKVRRDVGILICNFPSNNGDARSLISRESFWTGLRPMTPDGTPIVGHTAFPNLYLNTGHGTLGWTMSCGLSATLG